MTTHGLTLVGEGFSPWTEKARWALDHHRILYRYEEYTPLLSEPWLRIRAGRGSGTISVPYLLGGDGLSLGDSFAIAREADRRGNGSLVPEDQIDEITTWNERSERLMRAGRARILAQTEENRELQSESLPSQLPQALRSMLGSVRPTCERSTPSARCPTRSSSPTSRRFAPRSPAIHRGRSSDASRSRTSRWRRRCKPCVRIGRSPRGSSPHSEKPGHAPSSPLDGRTSSRGATP